MQDEPRRHVIGGPGWELPAAPVRATEPTGGPVLASVLADEERFYAEFIIRHYMRSVTAPRTGRER